MKEANLPPAEEELERRLIKHFAGVCIYTHILIQLYISYTVFFFSRTSFHVLTYMCMRVTEIEMQKRRSETNLRFYNARERIQEDADKEKVCIIYILIVVTLIHYLFSSSILIYMCCLSYYLTIGASG